MKIWRPVQTAGSLWRGHRRGRPGRGRARGWWAAARRRAWRRRRGRGGRRGGGRRGWGECGRVAVGVKVLQLSDVGFGAAQAPKETHTAWASTQLGHLNGIAPRRWRLLSAADARRWPVAAATNRPFLSKVCCAGASSPALKPHQRHREVVGNDFVQAPRQVHQLVHLGGTDVRRRQGRWGCEQVGAKGRISSHAWGLPEMGGGDRERQQAGGCTTSAALLPQSTLPWR
jgi:hypothetical protein